MTKIAKSWAHSSRYPCFRSIPEPELPTTETSEEQVNAAVKVVKKLKIKNCNLLEQFENPDLQGHYRMIESLALGKDLNWPGYLTSLLRPNTTYLWSMGCKLNSGPTITISSPTWHSLLFERSIFQTFWKPNSCTDSLFLKLETSNIGYLLIFWFPFAVQSFRSEIPGFRPPHQKQV